eukprot:15370902-Alexandrium_andersonii.AAC.1
MQRQSCKLLQRVTEGCWTVARCFAVVLPPAFAFCLPSVRSMLDPLTLRMHADAFCMHSCVGQIDRHA